MPIAVTEDHEDLRRTASRWLESYCPPDVSRAALEASPTELPAVWKEMVTQGWLGLHVPERHGGQGFGLSELAVVLDELGYQGFPGPVLPTVAVAALVTSYADEELQGQVLAGLANGSSPAALALGAGYLEGTHVPATSELLVSGTLSPVLGAPTAELMLAPVRLGPDLTHENEVWCLLERQGGAVDASITVESLSGLDPTRPVGTVTVDGVSVSLAHQLTALTTDRVLDVMLSLASAESAGGARWCLDAASDYAKSRVQFGRPIGQFQAIKHRLADMLVALEQAEATAWDAAQTWDTSSSAQNDAATLEAQALLSAGAAGIIAVDAFVESAKACVQILGGIGFTWEHDAHRYLKRAMATRLLTANVDTLSRRTTTLALSGVRRSLSADLPPEADDVRDSVRDLVAGAAALSGADQRGYLIEHGLIAPHWPTPWGRGASPLEQLVIDEQLAANGVIRPHLGVGAWALPTLVAHATAEQQERWLRPTLEGSVTWCQLFSEPGAGSDLASLSTKAERVDGGWRINGQKVWTSLAHQADWGMCLARSDPQAAKHDGITYFVVDMRSEGIDIRPLREMTGAAMFNEVFLNDVFVPDECRIGEPGEGWRVARTTLANERVSMSSGEAFGIGAEALLKTLSRLQTPPDSDAFTHVGHLVAEAHAVRLLAHRTTLRSLQGLDAAAGASVRKLLGAEHEQRVQEAGLLLMGAEGAAGETSRRWGEGFLATRCLTIAGGTSEVQRNVIAERLLGQPRDPEPGS